MATFTFQKPDKVIMIDSTDFEGKFEFRPLEPGYGLTIGNALRRVLLSSLEGFAFTSIKIDDVDHEFTSLPGIVEDVTEIILNLKQIRLKRQIDSVDNETERVEWDKNFDYFLEIVSSYFSAKNISTNWETLRNADHENLVNSLSMLCPFENYEKQALLEAHSLTDRKNVLSTLMEMASQNQGNDIIQ